MAPRGRVTRNLVSLVTAQAATSVISILLLVLVPHYFNAQQYGVLQFSATFVGYFGLAALFGTSTFLIKTIARDPETLGFFVYNALVMKLALSAVLAGAAVGVIHVLGAPHDTVLVVEIYSASMIVSTLNDSLVAGLQGVQRMGGPAAAAVVQQYVMGAALVVVLVSRLGVIAYAIAAAAPILVSLVANGAQLRHELRGTFNVDARAWRTIAVGGLPFLAWNAVLVIYGTIDIPILQALAGSTTVGWYALAYTWVSTPAGFSSLVVTAIFPSLAAEGTSISPAFTQMANRALRLVILVGAPIATGIALVAADAFKFLHYNPSFSHAVPLLQILSLHIPVVAMDIILGITLIASDRQKSWLLVGCIAACVNPLLNLFAIPVSIHQFHNGAVGAAIVTVVTEVLMMIGAIHLRPKGVLDRATVSYLLRCAGASLAMIPAVLVARHSPLFVKVGIGVVVYAAASFLLGTMTRDLIVRARWHLQDAISARR